MYFEKTLKQLFLKTLPIISNKLIISNIDNDNIYNENDILIIRIEKSMNNNNKYNSL